MKTNKTIISIDGYYFISRYKDKESRLKGKCHDFISVGHNFIPGDTLQAIGRYFAGYMNGGYYALIGVGDGRQPTEWKNIRLCGENQYRKGGLVRQCGFNYEIRQEGTQKYLYVSGFDVWVEAEFGLDEALFEWKEIGLFSLGSPFALSYFDDLILPNKANYEEVWVVDYCIHIMCGIGINRLMPGEEPEWPS